MTKPDSTVTEFHRLATLERLVDEVRTAAYNAGFQVGSEATDNEMNEALERSRRAKAELLAHVTDAGSVHLASDSVVCAEPGEEVTTDQMLELAGALEQRRALAIVEAVAALSVGLEQASYRAGFEMACEEITHRLRTEVWEGCLPPVDAPKGASGAGDRDAP